MKARVFTRDASVTLNGFKFATNCAIDAVFRNDDAAFEAQAFAEGALPKTYRVRVH